MFVCSKYPPGLLWFCFTDLHCGWLAKYSGYVTLKSSDSDLLTHIYSIYIYSGYVTLKSSDSDLLTHIFPWLVPVTYHNLLQILIVSLPYLQRFQLVTV